MAVSPSGPTLDELVQAVLEELGVQAVGQPVSAEDSDLVVRRIAPKLEELNLRDVASLDINNIGVGEFLPLVKIMAYELASSFSITDATKLSVLRAQGGQGGEAEGTLKDVVRLRSPRQTMRVEIFNRPTWGRRWR